MTRRAAVLLAVVLAAPVAAQNTYKPGRTPDGHPDMQGMWARRGVAMAEANPPNAFAAAVKGSELMEFACAEGSQTLPNIFGFGLFPGQ